MKNTVLLFLSLVIAGLNGNLFNLKAEEVKTLEIGASAPAFSLPGVDGRTYSLESFKESKIVMIVFMANHCPTAQAYEDRVLQLYSEFFPQGVAIVLVSPNDPRAVCLEEIGYSDLGDSFDEMKIRARDKNFPMPYLYDGDNQEMAKAYGPTTTPHVFIFDNQRRLRFCGRIDEMENPYEKATQHDTRTPLMALLEGKPVQVEKTKTFGCSIKWSSKIEWRNKLDEDWGKKQVDVLETDINGIKELLANNSKTYRLVNVWATWCGPCVIEFPEFVTMQRMYGARDFELYPSALTGLRKEKFCDFLKSRVHNKLSVFRRG